MDSKAVQRSALCRSRRELSKRIFSCKFWLRYSRERALESLPDRSAARLLLARQASSGGEQDGGVRGLVHAELQVRLRPWKKTLPNLSARSLVFYFLFTEYFLFTTARRPRARPPYFFIFLPSFAKFLNCFHFS